MPEVVSVCKRCGQMISWTKTKKGKNMPLDPAGRNHLVYCKLVKSA